MATLWPVGVAIYIIGTVGEALGANLQRYSFRMEEAKAESERENPWQQTPWVAGFFLFVFSGIGMSVSLFFCIADAASPIAAVLVREQRTFCALPESRTLLLPNRWSRDSHGDGWCSDVCHHCPKALRRL